MWYQTNPCLTGYFGERVSFGADDRAPYGKTVFGRRLPQGENDVRTFFFIVLLSSSSSSSSLLYYFVCAEQLKFTPTDRGYARTRALHHVSVLRK